jgi:hypothetical protein
MTLGVAGTAGHGPNCQHSPTITLFEIRLQWFVSGEKRDCLQARQPSLDISVSEA